MEVFERIKEIRKELFNDSNVEFANFMGEKTSTTSGWVSGRRGIGKNVIDKITAKIPQVNPGWLLTGEGHMLVNIGCINEAAQIDEPIILHVPLVSQYAQAGYLCGYSDASYMATLPTIPYIVDHEAQGHYVAFEVRGDSMNDGTEEAIIEGDRLLCREIMPHLWSDSKLHIRKWDFVIVHSEGILVKRIIDHDVINHKITVHSLNSMYEDKIIDLSEVKQIFNVVELQRPRRR